MCKASVFQYWEQEKMMFAPPSMKIILAADRSCLEISSPGMVHCPKAVAPSILDICWLKFEESVPSIFFTHCSCLEVCTSQ